VNDSSEALFRFHERLDRTAGEGLNSGANGADGERRKAGAGGSGQLNAYVRIDGGRAVNGVANEVRDGLTQPIGQFLGNVSESVVNGGGQSEARERGVIQKCLDYLCHHSSALIVTDEFRLSLHSFPNA